MKSGSYGCTCPQLCARALILIVLNIYFLFIHAEHSRGPNIMRGYFNNQKATDETITRDGWLRSGDLACLDEDGFVYIKDRGMCINFFVMFRARVEVYSF